MQTRDCVCVVDISPDFSDPICSLQDLCSELGVDDVENLVLEIRELSRRLEQAGRYQEVSEPIHPYTHYSHWHLGAVAYT